MTRPRKRPARSPAKRPRYMPASHVADLLCLHLADHVRDCRSVADTNTLSFRQLNNRFRASERQLPFTLDRAYSVGDFTWLDLLVSDLAALCRAQQVALVRVRSVECEGRWSIILHFEPLPWWLLLWLHGQATPICFRAPRPANASPT